MSRNETIDFEKQEENILLKIPKLQKFVFSSVLLLLLSSVSPVVSALDSKTNAEIRISEFQLLTFCNKMNLTVENLHDDASKINLTVESIQAAVESRLRSARLYTSRDTITDAYLYVSINVVGNSFNIELSFEKIVEDKFSQIQQFATTWSRGFTGRGGASFILSSLSKLMDIFLVEYLTVNEEYCN